MTPASSESSRSSSLRGWAVVALIAVAGWLFLSLDGRHYWHDVRFLFATTQFSFGDVLDGRFNPDQSWTRVDEQGSAGFYASKVGHLWLLRTIYALVPPGDGGVEVAVAFSVICVLAIAVAAGFLIGRIAESPGIRWTGVVAFLLMPVTAYMAGKQIAEVTALLFTTCGLLLLVDGRTGAGRRVPLRMLGCSALLLLALSARLDSAFGIAGFFIASVCVTPDPVTRRNRIASMAVLMAALALTYVGLVFAIGSSPYEYARYLLALIRAPNRPAVMSALSIVTFAGIMLPLAAMSLLSVRRRAVAFFAIWWIAAWLPAIVITSAFMVEPRYLAQGLVPLTGLVVLGVEALATRVPRLARPTPAALVVVLVLLPIDWLTIRLMPNELDRPRILAAVERITAQEPDAAILVPWAYTDFHFLRSVLPDADIYSVHSPERLHVMGDLETEWHERYRRWYHGRHITDSDSLLALMRARPVYYLGWHRYPPVEFARDAAARAGLQPVVSALQGLDLLDHLETSWVRSWRNAQFEPVGSSGQYVYFRLTETATPVMDGTASAPAVHPDGAASILMQVVMPPAELDGSGGIIAAQLGGDSRMEILVTRPGVVTAVSMDGSVLWSRETDIHLTTQSEDHGLPGWDGPGVQAADIDGDGGTEVLFLARDGLLTVLNGWTGEPLRRVRLPAPVAGGRWEHLVIANFRGLGDRDLLLQTTNTDGYRMGRYLAAVSLDGVLQSDSATLLWQHDDFLAAAHSGARLADLDGDGRDEVIGGSIVRWNGEKATELDVIGHIDAVSVADVRPDLPGLEVVALEETHAPNLLSWQNVLAYRINAINKALFGPGNRVFLFNAEGLIWETHYRHEEPQNTAVGRFVPETPGLEIWCRSRFDEYQHPFVFDASGNRIADYSLARAAPAGWTSKGVEVIAPIHWTGGEKQLVAAKARHESGDVGLFDAMTGAFVLRVEDRADRIYVADVSGDWREEFVVMSGNALRVYGNPADNLRPDRPSLWTEPHYRRSKQNWNYYNP